MSKKGNFEYPVSCPMWMTSLKLIEAEWRIYASVIYTTTGSDNGLSPDRHQAIIWTNASVKF